MLTDCTFLYLPLGFTRKVSDNVTLSLTLREKVSCKPACVSNMSDNTWGLS